MSDQEYVRWCAITVRSNHWAKFLDDLREQFTQDLLIECNELELDPQKVIKQANCLATLDDLERHMISIADSAVDI